jgi:2-polyprenyl-3-methyl-5-hydroxy-6-metoxy-1,4-benzoquinol methylase
MIATKQKQEDEVKTILERWPNLARLTRVVLNCWPEHVGYLHKSFTARTDALMATSEHVASAVLALAGTRASQMAEDYRWLCACIKKEEIEFARTGRYRFTSFKETEAHVYSDAAFMARYMHGLLFSHVLWYMHASSLHFFRSRLEARVPGDRRVLEVGSGHGLLLYLALTDLGCAEAHAWDLSEVSLQQTRAALALLGAEDKAHFSIRDMHRIEPKGESFDLIILSHILEHLEDPISALERIRFLLGENGLLFVNVPLNAPMPDHIVLLETPDAAVDLLRRGGFQPVEFAAHTTQSMSLSKALRQKIAVTCSIIAEVHRKP